MRLLPSLNGLRVFEAAGRHMSFTIAADDLCITQGAVSRAIRSLEDQLGVPLFVRHARRLEFTEEGRSLWLSVHDAIGALERAAQRVSEKGGVRVLTVNVLPTFASKWLMPRLVDFNNRHPDIEVRLTTSIRPADFRRDDIDVAIRVGQPADKPSPDGAPRIDLSMVESFVDVQLERLLPDELAPVASPSLLAGRTLTSPKELEAFTLLHNATRQQAWSDWFLALGHKPPAADRGVYFGHFFLTIQAAIQGQGIALVPRILVDDDLASGRLVLAMDTRIPSAGDYYLIARKVNWDLRKIRIFREWLCGTIREEAGEAEPEEAAALVA